jgi:hypothetical protein
MDAGVATTEPWTPRAFGPARTTVLATAEDMLRFAALHVDDVALAALRRVHAQVHIHAWLDAWCLGWARFADLMESLLGSTLRSYGSTPRLAEPVISRVRGTYAWPDRRVDVRVADEALVLESARGSLEAHRSTITRSSSTQRIPTRRASHSADSTNSASRRALTRCFGGCPGLRRRHRWPRGSGHEVDE